MDVRAQQAVSETNLDPPRIMFRRNTVLVWLSMFIWLKRLRNDHDSLVNMTALKRHHFCSSFLALDTFGLVLIPLLPRCNSQCLTHHCKTIRCLGLCIIRMHWQPPFDFSPQRQPQFTFMCLVSVTVWSPARRQASWSSARNTSFSPNAPTGHPSYFLDWYPQGPRRCK